MSAASQTANTVTLSTMESGDLPPPLLDRESAHASGLSSPSGLATRFRTKSPTELVETLAFADFDTLRLGSEMFLGRADSHQVGTELRPALPEPIGLSVIIPAWNEQDRLARTLERYLPALESRAVPFEVIVVVDGVGDRTAEVAADYADRNVRVLRFPTKQGKGGAVLAGLQEARHEYVGYLDADGPVSPEALYGMVGALNDVDCVVASRWVRGADGVKAEPLFNRFAGRVWNFLTRSLLLLPLRDTQCGAKFFRRSVVRPLLRTVTLTNRAFDVGILYHLRKSGHAIREVPVQWTHDPATRMPVGRAIPAMFLSLLGMRVMNSPVASRVPPRLVRWFQDRFSSA
jgi:dolichol-phosphate mannosyltransferase